MNNLKTNKNTIITFTPDELNAMSFFDLYMVAHFTYYNNTAIYNTAIVRHTPEGYVKIFDLALIDDSDIISIISLGTVLPQNPNKYCIFHYGSNNKNGNIYYYMSNETHAFFDDFFHQAYNLFLLYKENEHLDKNYLSYKTYNKSRYLKIH